MKCHFVYVDDLGYVLIPSCWAVTISDDIEDCTCRLQPSFNRFEKKEFKEKVKQLEELIIECETIIEEQKNTIQKLIENDRKSDIES